MLVYGISKWVCKLYIKNTHIPQMQSVFRSYTLDGECCALYVAVVPSRAFDKWNEIEVFRYTWMCVILSFWTCSQLTFARSINDMKLSLSKRNIFEVFECRGVERVAKVIKIKTELSFQWTNQQKVYRFFWPDTVLGVEWHSYVLYEHQHTHTHSHKYSHIQSNYIVIEARLCCVRALATVNLMYGNSAYAIKYNR